MKNTSSLFLTLVSYLITLATIIFLLFTIMPPSLKAQTNADMVATNTAVTNTTAAATVEKTQAGQAAPAQINIPGVHIGSANKHEEETFVGALALMIPIVGIVMGCSIPMVIVGLLLYFRHRRNKMLHETVRAMVEKGVPVPPEMFKHAGSESPLFAGHAKRPRNDLRTALIFIGLGVGLAIFMNNKAGFVVLFVGLAFLAASFFEKNNKNDGQPPKP
jgi:hypothetical protein